MNKLETVKQYYQIDQKEISYLKFIFEGYDGIAVVTTIDAKKGIIVLTIAPGCDREVTMVLDDLKSSMMIEQVDIQ